MFVRERFILNQYTVDQLHDMEPEFGYNGFGEFIFYRTYSRWNGKKQENWADCVIRVINGIASIRRDWYIKNHISWREDFWQDYFSKMAIAMFKMEWLPPGRGLWACGTDFVYERGSMALYNCAMTNLGDKFESDLAWLMDCLMLGVGVGFSPLRNDSLEFEPPAWSRYDLVIPDTREGWVDSIYKLIQSIRCGTPRPRMIYDEIRPAGLPIRGFGGISSGPEPLKYLHEQTEELMELYMEDKYYDSVMLKTDLANLNGICTISGNVRRSAELASLSVNDPTFKNLKDYEDEKYAYRSSWGWMSNNSVVLKDDEDFEKLDEIAQRVIKRGEPGYLNLQNFQYGRLGKKDKVRKDKAIGINPCGEIPLFSREVCNIAETLPTRCDNEKIWYKACEYATVYTSTVSLLPTHQPSTNRIVARNRRIGVSIIDYTGWKHICGVNQTTKWMRKGYDKVRRTSRWTNGEAGVPFPIRCTTIKPGGTTPKLAGRTSGAGHPTFEYTLRRVIVAKNSQIAQLLIEAKVPYEDSVTDKYSYVFAWPILQGPSRPAELVSLWEQAMNLVLLQREWADNAVSNTLYFQPKWKLTRLFGTEDELKNYMADALIEEESYYIMLAKVLAGEEDFVIDNYRVEITYDKDTDDMIGSKLYKYNPSHEEDSIEAVLSAIAPLTKTVSLLPHTAEGVYAQMPESRLTVEEYERLRNQILPIDWSRLTHSIGIDERYCQGATCEIPASLGETNGQRKADSTS